jgi:hypothetical protein
LEGKARPLGGGATIDGIGLGGDASETAATVAWRAGRLLDGGSYRVVDGLSGANLGIASPPCLVLATKFGRAPAFGWLSGGWALQA